jgi:hypothetical protein
MRLEQWMKISAAVAALSAPAAVAAPQLAAVCHGVSETGAGAFAAFAYANTDGSFARVVLLGKTASDWVQLGDYDYFEDVSTPPPTDVRFTLRFYDPESNPGYMVTLSEGGFTTRLTAGIDRLVDGAPAQLASLNCSRGED